MLKSKIVEKSLSLLGMACLISLVSLIVALPAKATTIIFGNPATFNSSSSHYNSVDSLDSNNFVVAYKDTGNSNWGTSVVGKTDVGNLAITYGTPVVFNSSQSDNISVATLDTTHCVIAFREVSELSFGRAIIGTISGNSISFGNKFTFSSGDATSISVTALDSTHFVVAYQDINNSDYGTAVVGTVSGGNSISYGTPVAFNSAYTQFIAVSALDSTHCVVAYQDVANSDYGTAVIGTVSGDIISYGSEYVFNTQSTDDNSVSNLGSSKFVVAFEDNNSYGTAIIGTVAGSTISYGSKSNFNSGRTGSISVSKLDNTHPVIAYSDTDNSAYGTNIIGTVSGNSISYGSEYIFNSAATTYVSTSGLDTSRFIDVFEGSGQGIIGQQQEEGGGVVPEFTIVTIVIAAVAGLGIFFLIRRRNLGRSVEESK